MDKEEIKKALRDNELIEQLKSDYGIAPKDGYFDEEFDDFLIKKNKSADLWLDGYRHKERPKSAVQLAKQKSKRRKKNKNPKTHRR